MDDQYRAEQQKRLLAVQRLIREIRVLCDLETHVDLPKETDDIDQYLWELLKSIQGRADRALSELADLLRVAVPEPDEVQ